MGLNQTPTGERVHIGIFGKRNAGKSSVLNAIANQEIAIVSAVPGTTTDPVYRSMELLPLGPVMFIDTPGFDDEGDLGKQRVEKSMQVLSKSDLILIVIDANTGIGTEEKGWIERCKEKKRPYLLIFNKIDSGVDVSRQKMDKNLQIYPHKIWVSAKNATGIHELKEQIARLTTDNSTERHLIRDFLSPMEVVLLVTPIDKAAPKGRLILPQQQTIRDILEANAIPILCSENQVQKTMAQLKYAPKMVITDSQVFEEVSRELPNSIMLTSFSILFARYKGILKDSVKGVAVIETLCEGDPVLICEGCTHHRQCDDIGTVKLPNWIRQYTGVNPTFHFTSGGDFPDDLTPYHMIVHCGGCMLNEREVQHRMNKATAKGVPMTNYGILIAQLKGILKRSVELFPEISSLF